MKAGYLASTQISFHGEVLPLITLALLYLTFTVIINAIVEAETNKSS